MQILHRRHDSVGTTTMLGSKDQLKSYSNLATFETLQSSSPQINVVALNICLCCRKQLPTVTTRNTTHNTECIKRHKRGAVYQQVSSWHVSSKCHHCSFLKLQACDPETRAHSQGGMHTSPICNEGIRFDLFLYLILLRCACCHAGVAPAWWYGMR